IRARALGREAHAPSARAGFGARGRRRLRGHEQTLEEASAETLERARDAPALEDIDADAEDQARAATIRAFISRTAAARPTNSACPITACPMLSSTISRTAATGCTLW